MICIGGECMQCIKSTNTKQQNYDDFIYLKEIALSLNYFIINHK